MNSIEKILSLSLCVCVSCSFIIPFYYECKDFIDNQNIENYFDENEVYNFSSEKYLIKDELILCGEEYTAGELIEKELYNSCKK